jgi:hypothetical protein
MPAAKALPSTAMMIAAPKPSSKMLGPICALTSLIPLIAVLLLKRRLKPPPVGMVDALLLVSAR